MAVWTSFMDLVHLIGAVGCLALTGGFAADGEPARALFYAAACLAFATALARRRHRDHRPRPVVVDLREAPAAAPTAAPAAAPAADTPRSAA
ncbi:hypothetical protein GTQ99_18370 [Kineococcus sp. T13]|uniref:hypothetical protein n=1 Tax=Kineococcus vitellinus TaxID=2696565 RepID=UPI0014136BA6|nr:hypothetical protein [Kineococcus vitellinus]NAZ77371.1 hypothetical protein [Kineococcus vitellinus]